MSCTTLYFVGAHNVNASESAHRESHPLKLMTGLLATGKSGKYNFWSVEFYQQFFDVDTADVKERIMAGMIPRPGKSFFSDVIKKNPGLYVYKLSLS